MSFALTEQQLLDGSKTVTRRLGWRDLQVGQTLTAVRKCMGIPKGGKQESLGIIEVTEVRRERLDSIGQADVVAEGFPEMDPAAFVDFFRKAMRCTPDTEVTVIGFKLVRTFE
ncbi:MAG: ASCH domain-containing protein [Myxococcales bacterium]|nr:ASCH domain-containing protein [Myxococcales bacterium]